MSRLQPAGATEQQLLVPVPDGLIVAEKKFLEFLVLYSSPIVLRASHLFIISSENFLYCTKNRCSYWGPLFFSEILFFSEVLFLATGILRTDERIINFFISEDNCNDDDESYSIRAG